MKNGNHSFYLRIFSCLFVCALLQIKCLALDLPFTAGDGTHFSITINNNGFSWSYTGTKGAFPVTLRFLGGGPGVRHDTGNLTFASEAGTNRSGVFNTFPWFAEVVSTAPGEVYGVNGTYVFAQNGRSYANWYFEQTEPLYPVHFNFHLSSAWSHSVNILQDGTTILDTISVQQSLVPVDYSYDFQLPEGAVITLSPSPEYAYDYDPIVVFPSTDLFDRIGAYNTPPEMLVHKLVYLNYTDAPVKLTIYLSGNSLAQITVPAAVGVTPGNYTYILSSDTAVSTSSITHSDINPKKITTRWDKQLATVIITNTSNAGATISAGVSTGISADGSTRTIAPESTDGGETKAPTNVVIDTGSGNSGNSGIAVNAGNNNSSFSTNSGSGSGSGSGDVDWLKEYMPDIPKKNDKDFAGDRDFYAQKMDADSKSILTSIGGGDINAAKNIVAPAFGAMSAPTNYVVQEPGIATPSAWSVTLPGVLSNITIDLNPLKYSGIQTAAQWSRILIAVFLAIWLGTVVVDITRQAVSGWMATAKEGSSAMRFDPTVGTSPGVITTLPLTAALTIAGRGITLAALIGAPAILLLILGGIGYTSILSGLSSANSILSQSSVSTALNLVDAFIPTSSVILAPLIRFGYLASATVIQYAVSLVVRLMPL